LSGQFHDRITGLYYNRHRFYDPRLGAYISQDPIGLKGGINLSAYVRNPMQWGDPWGLDPTQVKTTDIGKIKGWWDKAKDIFDWKENVEKGKAIKKNKIL